MRLQKVKAEAAAVAQLEAEKKKKQESEEKERVKAEAEKHRMQAIANNIAAVAAAKNLVCSPSQTHARTQGREEAENRSRCKRSKYAHTYKYAQESTITLLTHVRNTCVAYA